TDTRTLFANPRHPYTEALFHALPDKAAETGERLYSIPGAPPDLVSPPQHCRFAARCRYVQDRCRETEPRLLGESPEHQYRCFYRAGEASPKGPLDEGTAREPAEVAEERFARIPAEVVLTADGLVKDFPVTKGLMQRKVGNVSAVAGVNI